MALRQGRREDVERASYYVWFLGAEESRGLRGRQYVTPVVADLVRKERHVEPCKVTLQVSGKGMKIVQHMSRPGSGRAGQVKHFVPDHAVTCAVREPAPDDDIVSCILLVFNPVTKCPVHVHTYRCDTPETAEMLETQLQTLAERPENRTRIQQIEARLVERGLLTAPPPPQQQGGSVRQKAGRTSRHEQGGGSKAGYQEDSSGIGSDDTASPDHRERTSSDEEEWEGTGASSEDLLQDSSHRWRHQRASCQLDVRGPGERHSPDIEDRITSGVSSSRRTPSQRQRSPPTVVPPERVDWSRGLTSAVDDDRDDDAPPPPPQRPPPDLVPLETTRDTRGHHQDLSRSWRHSRPHPEGGRGIYEDRSRYRAREDGRVRSSTGHRRQDESLPAPPGGEPRPEELLSRVDRWVLNSVTVAETTAPGVRRRHSGRQHADRRTRSPSADTAGRLVKSRSTDTFLEHDVASAREPWRRPPSAQVAEEMRRQSLTRDEPVQRSRSSAHVGEETRRAAAAREESVQRCRSSPQVTEELRRRLAAMEVREARDERESREARELREARDAREVREARETRDAREGRGMKDARDTREAREMRDAREVREARELRDTRDAREIREARELREAREAREERESPRPRHVMQRCRSSTSLLDQRSPDRGRHQEPLSGGWRGSSRKADTSRRWGTLDRDYRDRPSSRRRELSRDSEQRHQAARELRPAEGSSRSRGQRAGSRTPDSELWMTTSGAGHDGRGRSRYSVADPRGVKEYDCRPMIAQPY